MLKLKSGVSRFKLHLGRSVAVWMWTKYSASQSLSFLPCKTRVIMPVLLTGLPRVVLMLHQAKKRCFINFKVLYKNISSCYYYQWVHGRLVISVSGGNSSQASTPWKDVRLFIWCAHMWLVFISPESMITLPFFFSGCSLHVCMCILHLWISRQCQLAAVSTSDCRNLCVTREP